MKKVLLVTILDNLNFGTFLQTYASVKLLEKRGYEVTVLNYRRTGESMFRQLRRIYNYHHSLLRLFFNFLIIRKATSNLFHFLHKNKINLTQEYHGFSSLQKKTPLADIYITGSDQVWNTKYNGGIDRTFFLDFVENGAKKYALAASIGLDKFGDEVGEVQMLLKKYEKISVRENAAVSLLKECGIESSNILDPTLMLSDEWRVIAKRDNRFVKREPYLLIYSVENQDEMLNHYARKIADTYKLKIYGVSSVRLNNKYQLFDKTFSLATPYTFLNVFMQADYVLVSSFHGTAFSINLGKQFWTIAPNKYSTRIDSLLNLLDLESRKIINLDMEIDRSIPIDYASVDRKLELLRNESNCFLDMIKE